MNEGVSVSIVYDEPAELGEGPQYEVSRDTLWWFDIVGRTLLEHRFATAETIVHPLPFMASELAIIDDHRQLIASENGLYIRDVASGTLTLHTPLEADNSVTRSNDGGVHPCGALWIGTMGKKAEKGAGAIYHFWRGELRKLYANITVPNAISFTPDGGTAYFTDTRTELLQRVAVDPGTGLPLGEPTIAHDQRGKKGDLDGAIVDRDGTIWIALWGAGLLNAYSPSGELVRSIAIPASLATCPAFVGPKSDRLIVTSAWEILSAEQRAREPHAGKTFFLDVEVKGWPAPRILLA
jgi:sugar lactone lactonase YvrE